MTVLAIYAKIKKKIVKKNMPKVKAKTAVKKSVMSKPVSKKAQKVSVKKAVAKMPVVAPVSKKSSQVRPVKNSPVVNEPVLNKKDLEFFKGKLDALKSEIMGQIKEISEDTLMQSQKDVTGEASGYSLHMADVASDNYEREFNFRVVSGDRELLLEIESAIKKIEDGEYGTCALCDKMIGRTRLSVIPYAKYCRKCKEQLEKDGKL